MPLPIVAKHLSLGNHRWCEAGIGGYLRNDSCTAMPRTDPKAPREETAASSARAAASMVNRRLT